MVDLREDLRQQDAIEASLQGYSRTELAGMMALLLKTYVIDGTTPAKPNVGRVHVPHTLRSLNFAHLIETLKFHLDLPDLDKFNVVDGQVYVKLGEREYSLDGPAPTAAPRAAPAAPTPAASPRSGQPAAPAPSGAPLRPSRSPLAAELDEPARKPQAPPAVDDRFRMLELD